MTDNLSLNQKNLEMLEKIKNRFPTKRSLIIPALHMAMEDIGFISREVIQYLSNLLNVEPIHVKEAASWYSMFSEKKIGKYNIQVCANITCSMLGAESIILYLASKLDIIPGETTKDGLFTITEVECLGSCGTAPVVKINEQFYENMTLQRLDEILEKLKNGKNIN